MRERALLIQPIFTPPVSSGSRKRRQSSTNGYQYLFISSPFQTSGSLSSFVFAANQSQVGGQYPQFQIWRCNGDNELMQMFETQIGAPLPSGLNVYQYIAEFYYMAGDFVGLFQPHTEKSALVVAFQMFDDVLNSPSSFRIPSNMPLSTYTYEESASSREELNYTPLVTVVMEPTTPMPSSGAVNVLQACVPNIVPTTSSVTKSTSQETDPTSTDLTSTNEPPPTLSRTATAPDTTSNTGNTVGSPLNVITIAGSAVGAVIGLLLVMVTMLVVFILALKCKKKKDKFEMSSVENPQYSAGGGKGTLIIVFVCLYVATIENLYLGVFV